VKLLFDEMLAPSLVNRLADLFQDSEHVRNLGLKQTPDTDVWRQAKQLGYVIVTKDKDFANLSLVWGAPPKVIQLQLGNCSVQQIEDRLRRDAVLIGEFVARSSKGLLVIRST
jgi:predicted nuclease of predicted toxin-antitoxin system